MIAWNQTNNYTPNPVDPNVGVIIPDSLGYYTSTFTPGSSAVYAANNIVVTRGQSFNLVFNRVGDLSFTASLQFQFGTYGDPNTFGGTAKPSVDYIPVGGWSGTAGILNVTFPSGSSAVSIPFNTLNVVGNVSNLDIGIGQYWAGPRPTGANLSLIGVFPNSTNSGGVPVVYMSAVILGNTQATPTYSLSATGTSVDEGKSATFTLKTSNVATGSLVPYSISGVTAPDITGGSLSGNFIIDSNGVGTISIPIAKDGPLQPMGLTEGTEYLTVTAGGKSATITVNDTSTYLYVYQISRNSEGVNKSV